MSPVAKSLIASLAIALVVAGTLALRGRSSPEARPQLTPAQLAEIAPPLKSEPPAVKPRPVNDAKDLPPPPDDEPEIEDGNGS
jgi:hypothetical protein